MAWYSIRPYGIRLLPMGIQIVEIFPVISHSETPFPEASHTSRDFYGGGMGMGVPLLGFPGISRHNEQ